MAEIEPLRTVIRDDSGNPVYLSNSEVASYGVRNLTQVRCRPGVPLLMPWDRPGLDAPSLSAEPRFAAWSPVPADRPQA